MKMMRMALAPLFVLHHKKENTQNASHHKNHNLIVRLLLLAACFFVVSCPKSYRACSVSLQRRPLVAQAGRWSYTSLPPASS